MRAYNMNSTAQLPILPSTFALKKANGARKTLQKKSPTVCSSNYNILFSHCQQRDCCV